MHKPISASVSQPTGGIRTKATQGKLPLRSRLHLGYSAALVDIYDKISTSRHFTAKPLACV